MNTDRPDQPAESAAVGEGLLAREQGDLALARAHLSRAQQMLAGQNEPDWTATTLVALGHVAELCGDLDSAEGHHRRAWQTAPGRAAALEGLACVSAARGDGADAARLLAAASWWRARRHRPLNLLEQGDVDRAADRARTLLGDDGFEAAYRAGAADPQSVVDHLEAALSNR